MRICLISIAYTVTFFIEMSDRRGFVSFFIQDSGEIFLDFLFHIYYPNKAL